MNLPRELIDCDYQTPLKAHYPQDLVSALYQLRQRIPIDFELVSHSDER